MNFSAQKRSSATAAQRTGARTGAIRMLTAAALLALSGTAALALPPLRDNAYINERLIAAQIGDDIRKACKTISPRLIYAYSEMKKLESYAKKLGYSDRQIKDFISNKDEKKRVRAAAWAYMSSKGVVEGNAESYCTLGRAEIAAGTITGSLLTSR